MSSLNISDLTSNLNSINTTISSLQYDLIGTTGSSYSDINNAISNLQTQKKNSQTFYNLASKISIDNDLQNEFNTLQSINNNAIQATTEQTQNDINNKVRLVEINQNYSKKYDAQSDIMKIFIVMCVVVMILLILSNTQYLPIPSFVYTILISVVIAVTCIVLVFRLYYLNIHNPMEFDNSNFYLFQKSESLPTVDLNVVGSTGDMKSGSSDKSVCQNQQCCPTGYSFDSHVGYCTLGQSLMNIIGH